MTVLPARGDLQPEQRYVVNRMTAPHVQDRVVLVQGVAGSGKTTIALSILRELIADHAESLLDGPDAVTPIFVTYNRRLVSSCWEQLTAAARLEHGGEGTGRVAPLNEIAPGKVSLAAVTEFYRKLLPEEKRTEYRTDEACVEIIRDLCVNRDVPVLPEQAFGIVTAFLKGHPHLRSLPEADFKRLLRDNVGLSDSFGQGANILAVRKALYGEYAERLARRSRQGGFKDRADLAEELRGALVSAEASFQKVLALTSEDLHRAVRDPVNSSHRRSVQQAWAWMVGVVERLADAPELSGPMARCLELMRGPGMQMSNTDWTWVQSEFRAAVARQGLRGVPPSSANLSLRNPLLIIDEVQDLSLMEVDVLVRLWFHQERSPSSKLVIFGDINQTQTPSGFTWEALIDLVTAAAKATGDRLPWFPVTYNFVSAEREPAADHLLTLPNNYRTTTSIAEFAHALMSGVLDSQAGRWSPQLRERLRAHVVHPDQTLELQITEPDRETPAWARAPGILVVEHAELQAALLRLGAGLDGAVGAERVVVIVGRRDILDDPQLAAMPIALIPLLGAKGLEFSGVIVAGLPVPVERERGIDPDMLAQWYTAVTRARVRLLLCVSPGEAEALREAGWAQLLERYGRPAERLDESLQIVGGVAVSAEASVTMADEYFRRFVASRSETWLREAVTAYQRAGESEAATRALARGAQLLKEWGNYGAAREHFRSLGDDRQEVECLLALKQADVALDVVARLDRSDNPLAVDLAGAVWEATGDAAHAARAAEIALRFGAWKAAWGMAQKGGDVALLRRVAADAREACPTVAFRAMLATDDERSAAELFQGLIRQGQFRDACDCLSESRGQAGAHNLGPMLVDKLARSRNPREILAGVRCYLDGLRDPLEAALALRGFLTIQHNELVGLGAFDVRKSPAARWHEAGFRRWLEQAGDFDAPREYRARLDRERAQVKDRRPADLDAQTEQALRGLVLEALAFPDQRSRFARVVADLRHAEEVLGDFLPSLRALQTELQIEPGAAPETVLTAADACRGYLPEIAEDLALGVARGRWLAGAADAGPDGRGIGKDVVLAARIFSAYAKQPWLRQDGLRPFLRELWEGDLHAAARCYAALDRQSEALDRLLRVSRDRWRGVLQILFPNSAAKQEEALRKLEERLAGPVVERASPGVEPARAGSADASLVADPGRKEAAAPVDASAFDPLIAWLNALEPGPGLSQTRDELLDEVRVAKRKALSNRRMSAQLVRELLPRLKGLPGAEPHVDRMAGFIEDA